MIGRGIGTAVVVVGVDQLSKHLVLRGFGEAACVPQQGVPVTGFSDIVLNCNHGMSFGLFDTGNGLSTPFFMILAVVIVGILFFWLSRVHSEVLATAIGMIIGGAIGNLIDRLWGSHGVIDFLYFHLGTWFRYPAFNAADSSICIGVAVMLFEGFLRRRSLPAAGEDDLRP